MARGMRRNDISETETTGNDSFLDVVTNIVGILIILVMVAGIRVGQIPVSVPDTQNKAQSDEVEALERQSAALESETFELAGEMELVAGVTLTRNRERATLAFLLAEEERRLESLRRQLDGKSRESFDIDRRVNAAKSELARRQRTLESVAAAGRPQVVEIKSYPTPISHTVAGKEAHFQLLGGRLVQVPLDELVDELKQQARHKAYKLRDLPEVTETVGPIDGFRLRYTLERVDVPIETQFESGRASIIRLFQYALVPMSDQLGEPMDAALAQGSRFRRALAGLNSRNTTITVWTYSDSFAEYRKLKEELYLLGFAVAARPLPMGYPIGGSPQGSSSAAQ